MSVERAVIDRAVAALSAMDSLPDCANSVHAAALVALHDAGFYVSAEVVVPGGRLDIVAISKGYPVAIEIDARKPRNKSLLKLRAWRYGRVVALRGVNIDRLPDGIHAAANIKVHTASTVDISDKRAVSKASALIREWREDEVCP